MFNKYANTGKHGNKYKYCFVSSNKGKQVRLYK